jgi:hypothetical protein
VGGDFLIEIILFIVLTIPTRSIRTIRKVTERVTSPNLSPYVEFALATTWATFKTRVEVFTLIINGLVHSMISLCGRYSPLLPAHSADA